MRQTINILLGFSAIILCSACGNSDSEAPAASGDPVDLSPDAPTVTFAPENDRVGEASGPVTIAYRIIGQPVVGQPVAIELRIASSTSDQPISVAYRINDSTALRLGDSQPASVSVAPLSDDDVGTQRVMVVPLREGRLYLNVSASIESSDSTTGTVAAIPIQVGGAPRTN